MPPATPPTPDPPTPDPPAPAPPSGGEPDAAGLGAAASARAVAGGLGRLVGAWLPIAAGVGLLAHLTYLGLRPALAERAFLEERRARLAAEGAELTAAEEEIERLERALADPIYRERLRWRWRLEGATAAAREGDRDAAGAEHGPARAGAAGLALPPTAPPPNDSSPNEPPPHETDGADS